MSKDYSSPSTKHEHIKPTGIYHGCKALRSARTQPRNKTIIHTIIKDKSVHEISLVGFRIDLLILSVRTYTMAPKYFKFPWLFHVPLAAHKTDKRVQPP